MKVMLDKGAIMPTRAHDLDAGLDIYSPRSATICPKGSVTISTGVHVEIPEGYFGLLAGKSGMNVKCDITTNGIGVIDAGYTGSVAVKLYNNSNNFYKIEAGDKIAQLIIVPIVTPTLELVESLDETERGNNGFGSTGR